MTRNFYVFFLIVLVSVVSVLLDFNNHETQPFWLVETLLIQFVGCLMGGRGKLSTVSSLNEKSCHTSLITPISVPSFVRQMDGASVELPMDQIVTLITMR